MMDIFLQDIEQPMLLVHAKTGVRYTQQCGATACNQRSIEGYLVPISMADDGIVMLTVKRLIDGKEGSDGIDIEALSDAVSMCRAYGPLGEAQYRTVALDRGRVDDLCEAWVPVLIHHDWRRISYRRATLIWCNSD